MNLNTIDVVILPVEDEDIQEIFDLAAVTLEPTEVAWRAYFPNSTKEDGRKAGAERYLQAKQRNQHAVYHKAVDTTDGKIVGFSIWAVYHNGMPEFRAQPPDSYWPSAEDAEYAKSMIGWFAQQRIARVRSMGGKAVHLNTLAVLPEYSRKGIGSKLLVWGLDKADELRLDSFLEASVMGRGLYENCLLYTSPSPRD